MKTSKYIDDSEDEGDREFKPTKRAQSDDDEEFEEDSKEVKKPKQEKSEKSESGVLRDTNGNQYFELSHKRRITINTFGNGDPAIHIREVYKDKASGEMRPGKSGVTLPIAQWIKLKELIPDVEEAIKALKK